MNTIGQREAVRFPGMLFLLGAVVLLILGVWQLIRFGQASELGTANVGQVWFALLLLLLGVLALFGLVVVQPNDSRVLTLFGRYNGSITRDGFHWVNPFTLRKKVSLKVRNFNSPTLKVNDASGNPIEIAAVVVWRVVDSAKAVFDVENYEQFVAIQAETAIRALANKNPYEAHEDGQASLRGNPDEVGEALKLELHKRLEIAGVDVMEARISHLAYAPEIAQTMLRRQQAQAVIAARQKIVEGAVGMVKQALSQLKEENVVELDEERKAAMVNNLLVALVSESEASPVINAGSIY